MFCTMCHSIVATERKGGEKYSQGQCPYCQEWFCTHIAHDSYACCQAQNVDFQQGRIDALWLINAKRREVYYTSAKAWTTLYNAEKYLLAQPLHNN